MTKVLVISDIHSNLTALEAVLADAGKVDEVWCLGDIAGYGPDPTECIERLSALPKLTCMMGNHDYATIDNRPLETFNPDARKALIWQKSILSEASMAFLGGISETPLVQGEVTLAHGSPRDSIWEYIMNTLVARINLIAFHTPWCCIGHSHFQAIFQYHKDRDEITIEMPKPGTRYELSDRAFLNPGSVGQPRDRDPRAAYAYYYPKTHIWEPHRVEYDIKAVQERIMAAGLPQRHADRLDEGA